MANTISDLGNTIQEFLNHLTTQTPVQDPGQTFSFIYQPNPKAQKHNDLLVRVIQLASELLINEDGTTNKLASMMLYYQFNFKMVRVEINGILYGNIYIHTKYGRFLFQSRKYTETHLRILLQLLDEFLRMSSAENLKSALNGFFYYINGHPVSAIYNRLLGDIIKVAYKTFYGNSNNINYDAVLLFQEDPLFQIEIEENSLTTVSANIVTPLGKIAFC